MLHLDPPGTSSEMDHRLTATQGTNELIWLQHIDNSHFTVEMWCQFLVQNDGSSASVSNGGHNVGSYEAGSSDNGDVTSVHRAMS
jgi:hypothetical protein